MKTENGRTAKGDAVPVVDGKESPEDGLSTVHDLGREFPLCRVAFYIMLLALAY